MTSQADLTTRIQVNAANPGEFLACCGIAELADRISANGVESYFNDGYFVLLSAVSVSELLEKLAAIEPVLLEEPLSGLRADEKVAPLQLPLVESGPLRLDAWTRLKVNRGKVALEADPFWKFWSGQQGVSSIWSKLRDQLKDQLDKKDIGSNSAEDLFQKRRFMTGRFGFDAQAAWNPLDVGYSPNDQKQPVATSPALELLALIGLQRVRPAILQNFQFEYSTWGNPLTPVAAAAAACGLLAVSPLARFRAQIIRRGQYGGLSHATRVSGGNS